MSRIFVRYCIMLLVLLPLCVQAQEMPDELQVYIRTDQLSVYDGNPLAVHVCVRNTSDRQQQFFLFDEDYVTFRPVVFSASGQEAQTNVRYRLENKRLEDVIQGAEPRRVVLGAGETFQKTFDMRRYYELVAGERYKIRVFFHPDARQEYVQAGDNTLYVNVMPAERGGSSAPALVARNTITPEEVVRLFLAAEKERRWTDYLKYVSLERFVQSFPDYASQYNRVDEYERPYVLRDFSSFLVQPRQDYILDFQILRGTVSDRDSNTAVVTARVRRYAGRAPFVYDYHYRLERYRDYWRLTEVEASVTRDSTP